jgi:tripartite-type tricarboxylate transporter receptor subunit TctC
VLFSIRRNGRQNATEWRTRPNEANTRAIPRFLTAILALLLASAGTSFAEPGYPTRPVNLYVAFPAGSGADVIARIVGRGLETVTGQPFIINNRPGATGAIAADVVKRAPPDGYTALVGTAATMSILWAVKTKPSFDSLRDFVPVTPISSTYYVLLVNPSVPAKTLPEFISYLKANPGKLNYGSGGVGSSPHLLGEMFKQASGTDMTHIPYQGTGPATNAAIAGDIQVTFDQLLAMNMVEGGLLRALGMTGLQRSPFAPTVPPIADTLPGFEGSAWLGLFLPAGTPPDIVEQLRADWIKASALPEIQKGLAAAANTVLSSGSEEFVRLIQSEADRWRQVAARAKIVLD